MIHLKYFEHKEYNIEDILDDMIENTYWVYYSFEDKKVIMKITSSDTNRKEYDIYTPSKSFIKGLYYYIKDIISAYEGTKIRKATEKEINEYEISEQANKYNI